MYTCIVIIRGIGLEIVIVYLYDSLRDRSSLSVLLACIWLLVEVAYALAIPWATVKAEWLNDASDFCKE